MMSFQFIFKKQYAGIVLSLCMFALTAQVQAENKVQDNQPLGRLFSKPIERNNLNVLRQNQKLKTTTAKETQQPEAILESAPTELPDPITLQGYVKRSDGASNTLWINGKVVQENSKVDSVKVGKLNQRGFSSKGASTEGVDVKIPANGKNVRLKAGQMYAPEDNKVYEMQVVEKSRRLHLEQSGSIDDNNSRSSANSDTE